jgi:hypothetical protein
MSSTQAPPDCDTLSPELQLNCWLVGDDASQIFPVKITKTETVGTLRKAIKEEKKIAFQYVDPDSLRLWPVSIPVDSTLQVRLANLVLPDESLQSVDQMFDIFKTSPAHKHLHIVVQPLVADRPVGKSIPSSRTRFTD